MLIVFSLLCTQAPLFNYLGFEFCALLALCAGYLGGLAVINGWIRSEGEKPPREFMIPAAASMLIMLFPPLVIMLVNAFFVKNCSLVDGLLLFLLLPVPAMLFAGALALLISVVFHRWRKTWYTLAMIALVLHIAVVTFGFPQVFAFNPILGYFPGITYDESLEIFGRLFVYRLSTIAAAALAVLVADMVYRSNRAGHATGRVWKNAEMVTVVAGLSLLTVFFFLSNAMGISSSETFIKSTLGGEYETEHFVISYPADRVSSEEAEKLALLHEFYFSLIARELRVVPTRKIHSFLYASPEQKGRLIGAAGTNISKPWLWQMHLNLRDVDAVLKHEMVHVMAAEFGFPLFRVSLNSGLIEGLAMAVERVEYDETLHKLAAEIYSTGIHPDVTSLFSVTGFLKAHGGTSYVIAGSFCRYLIDQYGMRRFKWLYRTGSFESFYNRSLETLVAEWRRYIDRQDPSRQEQVKAAYLFRRPSIFGKECARVIANLNADTRVLLREKKFAQAAQSSERSLNLTVSPEAVFQHAAALFRMKKYRDVIEFSVAGLKDSTMAHVLLPLYLTLGDAYWALGLPMEAKQMYDELYSVHLSFAWDESMGVRMAAVEDPWAAVNLKEYFVSGMEDSLRGQWLDSLLSGKTHSALVHYLLAREKMQSGKYEETLELLGKLSPISSGILEFSRYRMMARAFFETGEFQKAKSFFWESLNFTSKAAHQLETSEWIARCDWMEGRARRREE